MMQRSKLDGIAPLVADPPRWNSTTRQNQTFEPIKGFLNCFKLGIPFKLKNSVQFSSVQFSSVQCNDREFSKVAGFLAATGIETATGLQGDFLLILLARKDRLEY